VLDDCSRAVAGYTVFLGAPSALNLSLALRQAIWRKTDPGWAVHGLPDVLYADHGSDFTSEHLAQVAADLHIELVHSAIARPQGRGKLERFFGTVTTELLPDLPGQLVHGQPASPPRLALPQLDAAIRQWIIGTYHQRMHRRPGSRRSRLGSPTAGCPAPLTASSSSTCCSSRSPRPGWCTETASASRACATSTRPSPPTSANRSRTPFPVVHLAIVSGCTHTSRATSVGS